MSSGADLILYIAALVFPPFPVIMKRGCGVQLVLNLILCFFGWLPGVLHAWYIIAATPKSRHRLHEHDHYRPSSSGKQHHSYEHVPPQQDYYPQGAGAPVGYVHYPQQQPQQYYKQGPPPKY